MTRCKACSSDNLRQVGYIDDTTGKWAKLFCNDCRFSWWVKWAQRILKEKS